MHWAYYNVALGNRLHLARFSSPPRRILDIGSGTGIWAISMAEKYPDARVVAIDLGCDHPEVSDIDFGVDFNPGKDFTTDDWAVEGEGSFDFNLEESYFGSSPPKASF